MISRIGKYTVEAELGRGGFGQVYKAWDPDVRQSVAIKVLLAEGDSELLKRFQLEVVTTASLHHKNIVTIYASGVEAGTPYLVMELLEGQTLGQIIKQRLAMSLMEKVRIMTQVAEGLAYANSRGVVHRDVKPANIMLLPDGQVKIMDFGIALAANRMTATVTMDGFIVGTVPYMAPEQFTSDGKASEQTDIFAFGDVYYELLTGKHPFEATMRDLSALRMAILSHDPTPLSRLLPVCPEALELLVQRTLAKEPEFRYQTFEEVRFDSAAVLVDLQQEEAATILREVPRILAAGDLQQARTRVREAQKLEPGNRQARQLLESIDLKLHEKVNRERVATRMAAAEKQMAERYFAEAVQNLEAAVRLDTTNVVLQMRLADAKAKLEGSIQANRLVEDARVKQQKGELDEALERLNRALAIDPDHTEAMRLSPRVRELLGRRQQDQGRDRAIRLAGEHLAARRFAEAMAALDKLDKLQAGEAAVRDLRSRIEFERGEEDRRVRAERFNLAVSKTRETMEAGELERARQMLAHLNKNFANEPGASEVLPRLRERLDGLLGKPGTRPDAVTAVVQQVRSLRDAGDVTGALAAIAEGRKRLGEQTVLMELAREIEAGTMSRRRDVPARPEDVNAVLRQAGSLRDAGDLRGALAAIAEGRNHLGEQTVLMELAREIEAEALFRTGDVPAPRSEAVTAVLKRAASLRDTGDLRGALAAIAEGRKQLGEQTVLMELAREIEAEALFRTRDEPAPRSEAVTAVLKRAGSLRDTGDLRGALAAIAEGRRRLGDHADLAKLTREIEAEVERRRYAAGLRDLIDAVQELMASGRPAEAVVRIGRSKEYKGEAEVIALLDSARAAAAGGVHKSAAESLAEAASLRAAGDRAQAVSNLESALTRYPDHAGIAQALRQLRDEVERERRGAEIQKHKSAVALAIEEGAWTNAETALRKARVEFPKEPSFDDLSAQVEAGLRDQRLQEAASLIQAKLAANNLPEAIEQIEATRAGFSRDPRWKALEEDVAKRRAYESGLAEAERQRREGRLADAETVLTGLLKAAPDARATQTLRVVREQRAEAEAVAEKVRECLRKYDIRQATAELETARAKYPDETGWTTLQVEIDARQAALRQQSAIADSLRECLKRGDFRAAAAKLAEGRSRHQNDALWSTLQAEIDARQAQAAEMAERVRECVRRGDVAEAAAQLAAARTNFPDESRWAELQKEVDASRRRAEISSVAENVRELLRRGNADQASVRLAAARTSYPEDGRWAEIQRELDARLADANADRVRECLSAGDLAQAAEQLAAARGLYPDDDRWAGLQAQIDGARRQAAIAAALESVREWLKRGNVGQAAAQLAAARSNYPDEPAWAELQAEVDVSRRRTEVAAAGEGVRDALARKDVTEAAARLRNARKTFPGERIWAELQREVDVCQANLTQASQIVSIIQAVRERVRRDDLVRAAAELASGRAKYPDDPSWTTLQLEIDAREEHLKRRAEVSAIAERVRVCLSRDDTTQAAAELTAARTRFPDEGAWRILQADVDTRQAELNRQAQITAISETVRERLMMGDASQEQIGAIVESIRECIQRNDLQLAAAELGGARIKFPEEGVWTTLKAELEARRALLTRQEHVRAIAERVRTRLKRGSPRQAAAELASGRAQYPDETLWTTLQAEIDAV